MTLTAAGHDLIERTVDQVLTRESELVASLSPTGRAQLAGQLQELLDEVAKRHRKPSSRRISFCASLCLAICGKVLRPLQCHN